MWWSTMLRPDLMERTVEAVPVDETTTHGWKYEKQIVYACVCFRRKKNRKRKEEDLDRRREIFRFRFGVKEGRRVETEKRVKIFDLGNRKEREIVSFFFFFNLGLLWKWDGEKFWSQVKHVKSDFGALWPFPSHIRLWGLSLNKLIK